MRGQFRHTASGWVRRFFRHSCRLRSNHLLVLALPLLFAGPQVAAQPDDDPPVPRNGTVDGTTATLTFSEAVVSTDPGALVIAFLLDGILDVDASVSPSAVSIDGETVTLTLGTGAEEGQTVTVIYEAGYVGESRLKDAAGNAVEAFYDFGITNNTGLDKTATPPVAPEAPMVTGRSTSSVDVDWSAPADNGSAITGYDLRYFQGGTDPPSDDDWVGANHSGTATGTTLTCLAAESAYRVQVRPVNARENTLTRSTDTDATRPTPYAPVTSTAGDEITYGVTTSGARIRAADWSLGNRHLQKRTLPTCGCMGGWNQSLTPMQCRKTSKHITD